MDVENGTTQVVKPTGATWNERWSWLSSRWGKLSAEKSIIEEVESYRQGYPRFSALIAAHDSFFVCRRFSQVRARLLLLKQDKVTMLENRLKAADEAENAALFLGKSRCDANPERLSVLLELDQQLADYDLFMERTCRVLGRKLASSRVRSSLQNWVRGNGCIAREERAFLDHAEDLIELEQSRDGVAAKLESWVEDNLIRFYGGFRQRRSFDISSDAHVYIYSGSLIRRVARMVFVIAMTILLLTPVAICSFINDTTSRIIVIIISNIVIQTVLCSLAKSRTIEIFVAAATYSTLLIIFLVGATPNGG